MTTAAVVQDVQAPFDSPEHALRVCYRLEARDVARITLYGARTAHASGSDDTPWERLAGASMVLSFVSRALLPDELAAVQACYTLPNNSALEARKRNDCMRLANYVHALQPAPPIEYVLDVCHQWAGYGRQHTDGMWSRQLGKHIKTLMYWRVGRPDRDQVGIFPALYGLYDQAIQRLTWKMREAGITRI